MRLISARYNPHEALWRVCVAVGWGELTIRMNGPFMHHEGWLYWEDMCLAASKPLVPVAPGKH